MENKCEYCGKPYLPKRTDAMYCSHTCRQLAYVLRKARSGIPLLGLEMDKQDRDHVQRPVQPLEEDSIEQLTDRNNEANNLSFRTEKEKELPVRTDIHIVNAHKVIPVNTDVKGNAVKANQEYKEYPSQYLKELDNLCEDRGNYHSLGDLMQKDEAGGWISERYRCLLECLLLFSEMKEVKLDDLKEVCNAFTDIILSRHYNNLHANYPYKNEIKQMRERIKKKCLSAGNNEILKYKLSKEEKQAMMVIRFELSQFVPKRKFDELKFKEFKIKKGG